MAGAVDPQGFLTPQGVMYLGDCIQYTRCVSKGTRRRLPNGLYFEAVEYPPEAIDVVLPEGTIYRPALPPGRTGSESDED